MYYILFYMKIEIQLLKREKRKNYSLHMELNKKD